MKKTVYSRLAAFFLAAVILLGGAPLSARAAVTAHFTDVPVSDWAYPYVERAYADGAISGTGGDPARGTGKFSPGSKVTYGQFLTIMTSAFYGDEVARERQSGGAWYAPGIRVAVKHELTYLSQDWLMEYANAAINRYNAAYIVVKLMQDKGADLPSQQERDAAAAKTGDWDKVREDAEAWPYYVSIVSAAGIISGVDSKGNFSGNGTIYRNSAAVIYMRLADKLGVSPNVGQNTSQNTSQSAAQNAALRKEYRLVYHEDWKRITAPGYKQELEEIFYEVYPRMWARWGGGTVSKAIPIHAQEHLEDAVMWVGYEWKSGAFQPYIEISADLQYDYSPSYATAHELVHVTQAIYPAEYEYSWWDECMADYGRFRYYHWTNMANLAAYDFYQADEACLRDWRYEAYGDSRWFFAYMDEKYPTTPQGYGLVDSIHYGIAAGRIKSDNPYDPTFAAVVKEVTGFNNIEELRQRYVQELDAGTWKFNGFAGYADNYITENIPGVPNPVYFTPREANLCAGATTYAVSGEASDRLAADNLVDGDRSTKWEAARGDVKDQKSLSWDVQHGLCITLGRPLTIDSYTLYHEGSRGNSSQNTVSWRIHYYDSQREEWKLLDQVSGNTQDVTTRNVTPVKTQNLWLEVLNSSGTGDGTVRLYELEVYNKG